MPIIQILHGNVRLGKARWKRKEREKKEDKQRFRRKKYFISQTRRDSIFEISGDKMKVM
jgi:hypothetical protein